MPDSQMDRMEALLKRLTKMVQDLDDKIENELFDDDDNKPSDNRFEDAGRDVSPDEIMRYGQAITYRKYTGVNAQKCKEFIEYILDHPNKFNSDEVKYARYADKPFSDLRLSHNSYRILNGAYDKIYHTDMPWRCSHGVMYKYGNRLHWIWNDEETVG